MSSHSSSRQMRGLLWVIQISLVVLLTSMACASAPEEQAPTPQSGFNLQGTWKCYDRYELPTGCLIRMWPDGAKWNGWIVQDFGVEQRCNRVEHRLDRVQIDGTRISLWFRDPQTQRFSRWELRLEIVTVNRLRSRSSNTPNTFVRVSR